MICPLLHPPMATVCAMIHRISDARANRDDCLRAAATAGIGQIGDIKVPGTPSGPRRVIEDGFLITIDGPESLE